MELKLLKLLLSNAFYTENTHRLSPKLFQDEAREIYEVIVKGHEQYAHDLTTGEVKALWRLDNPVAVRAKKDVIDAIIDDIEAEEPYTGDVASDIIAGMWRRENGRRIAELGIALSEGKNGAYSEIERIILTTKDGFMPDDFEPEITKDLDALLAFTSNDNRWQFNISSLRQVAYGFGGGEFMIGYARPETGKTAFGVSLACGPGGFCEQGAKVLIGGNEEDPKKTMLRAYQAAAGMSRTDIALNPEDAVKAFSRVSDNFSMMDIQGWYLSKLESYISINKPDIVIIDQLDKIKVAGDWDSRGSHERLRELYLQTREIAKTYDCAILGLCQASADAEGKSILTPDMMEGSKTGKYAEADMIIGIGKGAERDGDTNPARYLNVNKNKITGWHGMVTCLLDTEKCRYVA